MKKVATIEDYLRDFSSHERVEFERIVMIAKSAADEIEEKISYGIPCIYYRGKMLIGFTVAKDHLSLFPGAEAIEMHKSDLAQFDLAKGTIRYSLENLVPDDTVKKLITTRKDAIDKQLTK